MNNEFSNNTSSNESNEINSITSNNIDSNKNKILQPLIDIQIYVSVFSIMTTIIFIFGICIFANNWNVIVKDGATPSFYEGYYNVHPQSWIDIYESFVNIMTFCAIFYAGVVIAFFLSVINPFYIVFTKEVKWVLIVFLTIIPFVNIIIMIAVIVIVKKKIKTTTIDDSVYYSEDLSRSYTTPITNDASTTTIKGVDEENSKNSVY